MVSTFGSLNTVMRGITAQQISINTTGHNLANASNDGFSRQRVNLTTGLPQRIFTGSGVAQLGSGSVTQSIIRCRDTFVDRQFWKQNPLLGYHKTTSEVLTKVEDILREPSESGLNAVLNNFWESINTLSTDASSSSHRVVTIANGVSLCTLIQQEEAQLRNLVSDINQKIRLQVDSINTITDEILSLNRQIAGTEIGGEDHANDLRDRRDYLVDQLSYIIDVQVTEDENGAFLINGCSGLSLVTATSKTNLEVKGTKDPDYGYEVLNIVNAKNQQDAIPKSGQLHGLINSRDSEESGVKKYLNDLANIAKFLLQEFNDVHKAGFDLDGNPGENFFGVNGVNYNDGDPLSPGYVVNWTNAQWLGSLKVSDSLTDPVTGAAKVAARTLLGELAISQSNPQSGHAIFSGTNNLNPGDIVEVRIPDVSSYPNIGYDTNGNLVDDTGTPTKILVDSHGNILELEYRIGAGGWNTCTVQQPPSETGSLTFEIGAPGGLTVQIGRIETYNTAGSTYTLTIPVNNQGNAAGDNAVNLCNRLKKDISSTTGDSSLDTYYSSVIGTLGVQVETSTLLADNQQIIIDQLKTARESVSGVNQEEEMSDMIRFQKAYNAASRILTAMDEMLEKLINGTGRVGA